MKLSLLANISHFSKNALFNSFLLTNSVLRIQFKPLSDTKHFKLERNGFNISAKFDVNLIELNLDKANSSVRIGSKNLSYMWLRENCKCPACFNYKTNEIDLDLLKIESTESTPSEINEINGHVQVKWKDDHVSTFDLNDLTLYALKNEINRHKLKQNPITQWNRQVLIDKNGGFNRINYNDYLNDKSVFKQSLQSVYDFGAVLIENVPNDPIGIKNVCRLIGPIQGSVFGEGYCIVNSNSGDFSDRAYSSLSLKTHTDTTYLKNNAGLELFHVIKKPKEGGLSVLVDGFYCANTLKEQYPEDYEFLKNTFIEFDFSDHAQFSFKSLDTHIKEDPIFNRLIQIRFNTYHKTNICHLTPIQMHLYYKAIKNFMKIIRDDSNECHLNLRQDQLLIFDNFRLLHGRTHINGERTLITAYLSRDDYLNKLRINNIDDSL